MNIVAFILAIAATVVFLVGALGPPPKGNLISLGLALLTAAWVVQLTFGGHGIHT